MTNGLIRGAKQQAIDVARQIAEQTAQELLEIPKKAPAQAMGMETLGASTTPQSMKPKTNVQTNAPSLAEQVTKEDKRKLDYLERELDALRRKKKLEEEQKRQFEQMQMSQAQPSKNQLVEPTTRPKRGFLGGIRQAIKQKQGTQEMAKGPSG